MKISNLYINEAIRIRRDYIDTLKTIVKYEEEIKRNKDELNKIKDELNDLVKNDKLTEIIYDSKLKAIDNYISKIQTTLKPYLNRIEQLNIDQKNLSLNIKDKYPDLDSEEVKKQIMEHIKNIK